MASVKSKVQESGDVWQPTEEERARLVELSNRPSAAQLSRDDSGMYRALKSARKEWNKRDANAK